MKGTLETKEYRLAIFIRLFVAFLSLHCYVDFDFWPVLYRLASACVELQVCYCVILL